MKCATLSALVAMVLAVSPAQADVCVTTESDLLKLINDVSVVTGRKFIVDPRVRANVTLAGFQAGGVDYDTLRGVLEAHDFTALEANDIVYVVPVAVAPTMRVKLGIDTSSPSGT